MTVPQEAIARVVFGIVDPRDMQDAINNIVQTIIGVVLTFGGAILLVIMFAGALTSWLRSRDRKA